MNYNEHTINGLFYNGHTIKRAYSCNGELVFGDEPTPPTPVNQKMYMHFDDGGDDAVVNCNSSDLITINEAVSALTGVGRSTYNGVISVEIGDCVTEIEHNLLAWTAATQAVETLTSVTIADSVTTIGHSFCQGRTNLVDIEFPSGVTAIQDYSFYDCKSLATFEIKEGVTTIGNEAFYGCTRFLNIVIPSTITSIGQGAFYVRGYSPSVDINRKVTCLATTPPDLGQIAFSYGNGTAAYPIYVPAQSLQDYKTAWNGKVDVNRIQAIQ